jgi:hypothetical protein
VKIGNAVSCLAARNDFDEPTIRFASGVSRERVTVLEYTSSNGEFVTGLFVGQSRVSAGHVSWDTTVAGITAAATIAATEAIFMVKKNTLRDIMLIAVDIHRNFINRNLIKSSLKCYY